MNLERMAPPIDPASLRPFPQTGRSRVRASLLACALLLTLTQVVPAQTGAQQPPPSAPTPAADALPALRHAIETGHTKDALAQLDALLAVTPAQAPTQLSETQTLRGNALYQQGNLPEADHAFAAALAAAPSNKEAGQMRGITLFRMGRPADAIPFLEKSGAAAQQQRSDPSYVLALCYMDGRRYDDARHAFAAQYSFPPDSAEAYLLTARMLLRREFLPVAQDFATKATQLNPQLPLAQELLGEIALAGNHLPEATQHFEAERARNPLEPGLYDRLGDTYVRAGDYPKALDALRRAILLEPNTTGPYILLGKTLLKQGDAAGALLYLERAKAMAPDNFMTRSLLGQAYRAEGRRDEAAAETKAAEQIQSASEPKLTAPR